MGRRRLRYHCRDLKVLCNFRGSSEKTLAGVWTVFRTHKEGCYNACLARTLRQVRTADARTASLPDGFHAPADEALEIVIS